MRRFAWLSPLIVAAFVACGGDTGRDTEDMDGGAGAADADAGDRDAAAAASGLACAPTVPADELAGRASPYDSATIEVGSGHAKICYGRPALRGRTMIGGEAVPYGQLWRFGANEPTIVHLDVAAQIAGIAVEPGSYSLYTVPAAGAEWTLIVNRSISQWGEEGRYTPEVEAQEVGRAQVRAEPVEPPIESFTIRANPDGTGVIAEWQNSRIHIPITAAG